MGSIAWSVGRCIRSLWARRCIRCWDWYWCRWSYRYRYLSSVLGSVFIVLHIVRGLGFGPGFRGLLQGWGWEWEMFWGEWIVVMSDVLSSKYYVSYSN
ncbi:hypothetical protein EX30DRAFT_172187 [Ascodesmis nigricans]|uniref:Uncharacterized protein n=1 Tax=Ascodesmis nigricans TaxID=341454 RepID=A0A4S2MLZ3_9PEZI|nr:hypothetical protein EX30DRAFT_172187 [Ascodesmis nigricans]